jgi:hypothetical protein
MNLNVSVFPAPLSPLKKEETEEMISKRTTKKRQEQKKKNRDKGNFSLT